MAHLLNTLSNQTTCCDIGPRWRRLVTPRAVYGPRQEVECPLDFAAQYFLIELLLPYPRPFRPEAISEELVTTLGVYVVSSPKIQKIHRQIVGDLELVCLIANAYDVTVYYKRDAYRCWLASQVALQSLIEVILPTVRYRWGHQLRRGSYLE